HVRLFENEPAGRRPIAVRIHVVRIRQKLRIEIAIGTKHQHSPLAGRVGGGDDGGGDGFYAEGAEHVAVDRLKVRRGLRGIRSRRKESYSDGGRELPQQRWSPAADRQPGKTWASRHAHADLFEQVEHAIDVR